MALGVDGRSVRLQRPDALRAYLCEMGPARGGGHHYRRGLCEFRERFESDYDD